MIHVSHQLCEAATRRRNKTGWARRAGAMVDGYIQSIIGAMEKRRGNGAGAGA